MRSAVYGDKVTHKEKRMKNMKKLFLFFAGLLIIPFLVVLTISLCVPEIDFFEKDLLAFLVFDYVLAYLIYPILYKTKIKKYISSEPILFAITFSILCIIDVLIIYYTR